MKDYISREAALNIIEHNDKVCHYTDEQYESVVYATTQYICEAIAKMSAADVQPVKHGRWEEIHISLCKWIPEDEKEEGHSFYMAELKCSCCERYNDVTFALTLNKPDFCQLCGARMDGAKMDLKDGDTYEYSMLQGLH